MWLRRRQARPDRGHRPSRPAHARGRSRRHPRARRYVCQSGGGLPPAGRLDAVAGLLETARGDDRVRIAAVDIACTPLSSGFAAATDAATRDAVRPPRCPHAPGLDRYCCSTPGCGRRVSRRRATPSDRLHRRRPGLAGIDPAAFAAVIDTLLSRRSPYRAWASAHRRTGPAWQRSPTARAACCSCPTRRSPPRMPREDRQPCHTRVWWPSEAMFTATSGPLPMLPAQLPPLRADRESVVLVEGDLQAATLACNLRGRSGNEPQLAEHRPGRSSGHGRKCVPARARPERPRHGRRVFLPILGREGLALARSVILGEAATLAASRQAEAAGAHDAALRLAQASLRRDPDNTQAELVRVVAEGRIEPAAPEVLHSGAGERAAVATGRDQCHAEGAGPTARAGGGRASRAPPGSRWPPIRMPPERSSRKCSGW